MDRDVTAISELEHIAFYDGGGRVHGGLGKRKREEIQEGIW